MNAHPSKRPQRGMTVVALLICLIVVTLIAAAILRLSGAQREFVRGQERRLQAEWLVESGMERCLAALAADGNYRGETWNISAGDLGLASNARSRTAEGKLEQPAAVVTITVDRVPDNALRRRVRVQADYPPESPRRARHSKQIVINLEPPQQGVKP